MYRKILSLALVVAFFGVVSVSVKAEGNASSDATVTFEPNSEPTLPVDPENPDLPGTGPGTGMPGPLSLDYVPNLDFGDQKITGSVETFEADDIRAFIQVTDTRGTAEGWSVTATLSDFTSTSNASKTLPGAVINFKNSSLATTSTNESIAPSAGEFALTAGGTSSTVVNAPEGSGMGSWVNRWFASNLTNQRNDNVLLTVDTSNALAQSYEATITWSLSAAP